MPKLKTHKGIAKRFRVSARGKLSFKPPGKSHLMSGKGGNRVRRLRKLGILGGTVADNLRSLIHNAKV